MLLLDRGDFFMKYGIQLYSVRDMALDDAIEKMSALGYSSVEFAGFFDKSADEITKLLKDNNIEIFGTHSGLKELSSDYEGTLCYHKAIGNKYYTIPAHRLKCQADIDDFVEKVNKLYPMLKAEGITLGFHNHAGEFKPNADGSVAFEQILYRTELALEVDAYWAYVGMGDPIAVLERVGDRLVAIHIKDGDSEGNGFPLGMGIAPVKDVYDWGVSHNIPLIVESETLTPSGFEEARICIEYLKSLEK